MALQVAEAILSSADEEQRNMMEERVILTDYYDNPLGSATKKESHLWSAIQAGMLHRAFSVFLFTQDGKLILQQRAATKITFARIWANTCCSHPLDCASESPMVDAEGVKAAAVRKLGQELGIPSEDVPLSSFTWITRVHYVAPSIDDDGRGGGVLQSGGASAAAAPPVWGEHEIDWIMMCVPPVDARITPNPNEVASVRAFSQPELREWVRGLSDRGEAVSPWFRVMEHSGLLYAWWDAVLESRIPDVLERNVIYRQHDLEARASGKEQGSVPPPPAFVACRDATHAGGVTKPLLVHAETRGSGMPSAAGVDLARVLL